MPAKFPIPLPLPRRPVPSSSRTRPPFHLLITPTTPPAARYLLPLLPSRTYANPPQKKNPGSNPKRKTQRQTFRQYDLADADQFSLREAVRYLRAFEVGQNPTSTKYELHVKLNAQKNGPTVKNRIKLPKAVKTDIRICVIAEGKFAEEALKEGAVLAGTDTVFEKVKAGVIEFDQCICHEPSFATLQKARVAPILGPRGLMPNPKFGTVVQNPAAAIKELTGKSDYRERLGVVRMAIGQLGFTEEELAKNIKAFMTQLKADIGMMASRTEKSIAEVVLSTTHGPGMSLNGDLKPAEDVPKNEEGESVLVAA